jgi:hypothetical protein
MLRLGYRLKSGTEGAVMSAVRGISPGEIVYIKEGEEKGSWGIVDSIDGNGFHVAIAGGHAPRLYDRDELQRPRDQEGKRREFGVI